MVTRGNDGTLPRTTVTPEEGLWGWLLGPGGPPPPGVPTEDFGPILPSTGGGLRALGTWTLDWLCCKQTFLLKRPLKTAGAARGCSAGKLVKNGVFLGFIHQLVLRGWG